VTTRGGFSLIEVLVVLVLIALFATVTTLAFRTDDSRVPGWRDQVLDARRQAIATGTIVTGFADSIGSFSVQPGGLIVADSAPRLSFAPKFHAR
jgi:prepilin-type N-terminal cleavage/methylation domain-containing protein